VCKIEKQLKTDIASLAEQTGRKITVDGKAYDVYIRQQWDEYYTSKEMEKKQRVCTVT